MRQPICLAMLLLIYSIGPAFGQSQCNVLAKLSRINKAIFENAASHNATAISNVIDVIALEAGRLDAEALNALFDGVPSPSQNQALISYLVILSDVMNLAAQGDMKSAEALVLQPETLRNVAQVNAISGAFECIDFSTSSINASNDSAPSVEGAAESNASTPSDSSNDGGAGKLSLAIAAVALAATAVASNMLTKGSLSIAGLVGSTTILSTVLRWKRKQHQRAERHELYYVLKWRSDNKADAVAEGVILDINAFGAKLVTSASLRQGDTGDINFGDEWHPARVQWVKDSACGLQFATRIRLATVTDLLNESRDPNFKATSQTALKKVACQSTPPQYLSREGGF